MLIILACGIPETGLSETLLQMKPLKYTGCMSSVPKGILEKIKANTNDWFHVW